MIVDSKLFTKIPERCVIKLSSIVGHKHPWYSEPAHNTLLDEVLNILMCNFCQGFSFYLFGEVINPYHQKFHLSGPSRKGIQNVQPLLCKGPWGHHWGKVLRRLSRDVIEPLTLITYLDIWFNISLNGWPVITCTDDLVDEWSSSGMVATCSFMNFSLYIICFFWS